MDLSWEPEKALFRLHPQGDFSVVPASRHYVLHFRGFRNVEEITASEGYEKTYDQENRTLTLRFDGEAPARGLEVSLKGKLLWDNHDLMERALSLIHILVNASVIPAV